MIGETAAAETLGGGRYELGAVLGTGGMAQVRSATDTVLGRPVAVKLFRADLDEDSAARARQEMQTLASLAHPGLVSVYDAGTEPDALGVAQPFLVMELVEGPTLAACCQDRSLTPERLTGIGAGLADALQYVHERGVVHRDVKPANILLSDAGVKLADFGIARIVDGARHTGTGLTIGTAPYLAPEQVTGAEVGTAADVYALGLVLLECLTGEREYTGGPVEVAMARLHRQPVVPDTLPAPWPGLLTSMTALAPRDRPTAGAVAAVLRGAPAVAPIVDQTQVFAEVGETSVLQTAHPQTRLLTGAVPVAGLGPEPGPTTGELRARSVPRVLPKPVPAAPVLDRGAAPTDRARVLLLDALGKTAVRIGLALLALLLIVLAIAASGSSGSSESTPTGPAVDKPVTPQEQRIADLKKAVTR